MKTHLIKWYSQIAATFSCPHCNAFYNIERDSSSPEMPGSLEETVICSVCGKTIEFDSEDVEYE